MSKYAVDDPWFEYLELPAQEKSSRSNEKAQKALSKRIARFRRSRRIKPFRRIL